MAAIMVVSVKTSAKADADPALLRIALSDGSLFSLKTYYLPLPYPSDGLCVADRELSGDEEEALRFAASCFRAEKNALRLIARAEQSAFGLSRKLERQGHAVSCVRAVVARLTDLEIVSDERFASRWVLARLNRTAAGPRDLLLALCRRGIPRNTAQAALRSILNPETESALLRRYLRKNHPALDGEDRTRRNSFLHGALRHAGFSPELLRRFREAEEL
jgi:regulatory protein